MEDTVTANAMARIRQYLQKRGIWRDEERADLPVQVVEPGAVPVRGSVHLSSGSVVRRSEIDKAFAKIRFAKLGWYADRF